jgi:ribosomal protein S18 acetylase RimI-like enzyme
MPDTKRRIRRISKAEMNVFRQIRLEALRCEPDAFASIYEDWLKFSDAEWRAEMNISIFVAFVDGKPAGLMGLRQLSPAKMMHRATLTMVYVGLSFRGSGLARELLDAVIGYAESKGIAQIELGVRADKERAVRFYQRAGFVAIGNVPDGYADTGDVFDETLMVLRIKSGHSG